MRDCRYNFVMEKRPQVSAFVAMSLDGYIATADYGVDWLAPFNASDEDYGYFEFFNSVDVLVMGHNTYKQVLAFEGDWPYAGKRVIVLSHAKPTEHEGVEWYQGGDLTQLLAQLTEQGVQHVYVDGGQVIAQLLALGCLDHLTITVMPVLLGSGIPLFQPNGPVQAIVLDNATSFSNGIIQLRYLRDTSVTLSVG